MAPAFDDHDIATDADAAALFSRYAGLGEAVYLVVSDAMHNNTSIEASFDEIVQLVRAFDASDPVEI